MLFISIIIPVYNRTALLTRAVQSVLAQSYRNFELIIIDDGSDVDVSKYLPLDQRIMLVRQKHRGVSAARNRGIKLAKGEYLCFLDSDDYWLPEKLKKQLAYLQRHPEFSIAQTEEIWIRNGKRVNAMKKHAKSGGDIFERSLELCLISPSAVIIKKKLLDKVGLFDETLPACEDYDLWLRITAKQAVGLLSEPLIEKYGGHSDQLSRFYPIMDRFRVKSLRNLLRHGQLNNRQKKQAQAVLAQKSLVIAKGAWRRKKIFSSGYYFLIAMHSSNGRSLL